MNHIKKIVFLLFIIGTVCYPQNFWEKINSPTSKLLNSLSFIDSSTGWVSGDSGLIFHTTNAGKDWVQQFENDSLNIVNIFFLNEQYGWASGYSDEYEPYGTFFLSTTNGGNQWNSEYLRLGEVIVHSFYFLDSLTGFAVGGPQVFHRTTDGGLNWVPVILDSSIASGIPPITIKFFNSKYGYACGGVRDIKGVVWRTIDGGISWTTVVDTLTTEPLYDIHLIDSLNIIAMGGDPEFGSSQIISTDGGITWEYRSLGIFYYPVSIGFRTDVEGWVPMGEQRFFLYTSDAGNNWTIVQTPDSTPVMRVCFPDSLHGFGIGPYGTIVKYVYQKPTYLNEHEIFPKDYYLEQNYPNPFNPSTTIKYSVAEDGFVKLAVYNMLGEEVAELENLYRNAGSYEVNFNASGLSSGMYIYRIETLNFTSSKKLILLR
ncbi:MAG: T9SS type A sorting domain-containing protein [Ignavibacteriota bacterium]|nr:MAG: T9SS C-terminal target domain-containing protein [Chlorobiota bacterium]MBL1122607.1 T9SS C-terminal target domain-containing protein [Ignavibacteriota bacterium]MCC7093861.1 T9SS type A sorting domain-containing protein [Ignavibacteriaceae bacterium]MEB2297031.1 YCF48-related protein [Ignavibacteria bacterium]QKJ95164.1 MAG: T9SS type A sorting domain-containing protein [Ignavibacteriota bacterium]